MYKVEYRDNGSPVLREYIGKIMIRESEEVGYQGIAVLKNPDELIMAFGDYYNGSYGLKSGVLYVVQEII